MNLVIIDCSYEKAVFMRGLGVNTDKTESYYIEATSKAIMNSGMHNEVYKSLTGTLKRKDVAPPYTFITWGGNDKAFFLKADGGTEYDLKCGGVIIDIEPLFHAMTIHSSLTKLSRKLSCGSHSKHQKAENHAIMIRRIIEQVNNLTDEVKYILDLVRLNMPEYEKDFLRMTNALIKYGVLKEESVKAILDLRPDRSLEGKELEEWYKEYKEELLTSDYKACNGSRLHKAKNLYASTGNILRGATGDFVDAKAKITAETELLRQRAVADLESRTFESKGIQHKGYYTKKKEVSI